jgi:hypothetical protein
VRSGGWVRDLDSHPVEGRIEAEQIIACVDPAQVVVRGCDQRFVLPGNHRIIESDFLRQFPIGLAAYRTLAL